MNILFLLLSRKTEEDDLLDRFASQRSGVTLGAELTQLRRKDEEEKREKVELCGDVMWFGWPLDMCVLAMSVCSVPFNAMFFVFFSWYVC